MTSFLLHNVRIFTGETVVDQGYLLVQDGKVKSIGPISNIPKLETSTKVYSKSGHTLLPGLIDCHIHADRADPEALPQALRFGVTTVC